MLIGLRRAYMPHALFRFFSELNDFLPDERKQSQFRHDFDHRGSIKDMIESLGIPHTEIDLITVESEPVDFTYIVQDRDAVCVYPLFRGIDIGSLPRLRQELPEERRFVLDGHLGRLATYLRLLGFDTLYRNDYTDEQLASISSVESRILLTRDKGLLKRSIVKFGYWVRETNPEKQMVEIVNRYDLSGLCAPFLRCLCCNSLLEPVSKESIIDRLPEKVKEFYQEFHKCFYCGKVYWKGTHYERMQQLIGRVVKL